ncbi:hypothetical protein Z959_07315 [Clostridium novyi B str. ATCC 27606]|uniref:VTT domain-containing protein n=2 Tax=Clostridium TaxID=1485 RepID=A0AA40IVU3_CLONO|nr:MULTISPECIES: VTT domain-containing protein [Clostridium]KEI11759.1 hypothetical protein Z958_08935 [Clostridium novyi B str. NCTC 9691]KEI16975.1 hypothetical protein Z960_07870 [Clostridium haemolyticum NCTC 9693]KEI17431.1 hypothetical protein Z959_07315 [Clostridium novyi B str. ATCC 27606]KGN02359.1 hypothetical protein Z961_08215 [Clostridium haemolyticum NCTC 8350]OOB75038.1 hypothetical protein AXF41_10500 [Clostridium haemolyticum]
MDINLFLYFITHFEKYLYIIVDQYGALTYIIIFFIIFCEAGFIILAFLPGDSLIFITGTLACIKILNISILLPILMVSVILGDVINYYIGKFLGKRILGMKENLLFKKDYIKKAQEFYNKNGRISIVLGRFIPIVRGFVGFVAGIVNMDFNNFISYSIIGGSLRVGIFLFSGYYLGMFEIVKNNLEIIIGIVILISTLPSILGIMKKGLHS